MLLPSAFVEVLVYVPLGGTVDDDEDEDVAEAAGATSGASV